MEYEYEVNPNMKEAIVSSSDGARYSVAINDESLARFPGLSEAIAEYATRSGLPHLVEKGHQEKEVQGDKQKNLFEAVETARKRAGLSANKQAVNSTISKFLELLEILDTGELGFDAIKKAYEDKAKSAMKDIEDKSIQAVHARLAHDAEVKKFKRDAADMRGEMDALADELKAVKSGALPLTDPRAIEVVNLQSALMRGYAAHDVSPDVAARCTSYTLWMYLGGDAGDPSALSGVEVATQDVSAQKTNEKRIHTRL